MALLRVGARPSEDRGVRASTRVLPVLVAVLAIAAAGPAGAAVDGPDGRAARAGAPGSAVVTAGAVDEDAARAVRAAVDAERRRAGLSPLLAAADLSRVARARAARLAATRGTVVPAPRLADEVRGWTVLAENTARGRDAGTLADALLASDEHVDAVRDPRLVEVAVAVAAAGADDLVVVQLFRRPQDEAAPDPGGDGPRAGPGRSGTAGDEPGRASEPGRPARPTSPSARDRADAPAGRGPAGDGSGASPRRPDDGAVAPVAEPEQDGPAGPDRPADGSTPGTSAAPEGPTSGDDGGVGRAREAAGRAEAGGAPGDLASWHLAVLLGATTGDGP